MKIYNLKRFSKPEFLRQINPKRLLAFLRKFPQGEAAVNDRKIDYDFLSEILASPEPGADTGIFDALAMIDAVSNDGNFDLLRRLTENKPYAGKLGDDVTVADLALTIWLHEPELLENVLNRHDRCYPRSFIYFRGLLVPRRYFVPPKPSLLRRLTRSLNKVFQRKKRGRNIKVTVLDESEEYQFMIRKGEPYSRDSAIQKNGSSGSIYYRPERFDLVVLRPNIAELRLAIHRKAPWLIEAYRTLFGYVFYGEKEYFSSEEIFTLEPLMMHGEKALVCRDVPGLDEVMLIQCKMLFDQDEIFALHGKQSIEKLMELKAKNLIKGQIISAKFKVRFTASKAERIVTVRLGNEAKFKYDDDGGIIEEWLLKRGIYRRHDRKLVRTTDGNKLGRNGQQ